MSGIQYWLVVSSLVSALSVICYIHSCWAGFAFDDNEAILSNNDISTDSPLVNIFTNDFWGENILDDKSHKSYRPLTVLTFRINYWFGGREPFGYHLVNVVLHAGASVLFMAVCVCLCKDFFSVQYMNAKTWIAVFPALMFASHPIHTESVAGVVGRADLTCALCYFTAFLAYRNACVYKELSLKVMLILLTLVLAGCALLFKEQGITILGVCLVYDALLMRLEPHEVIRIRVPKINKEEWKWFLTRCSVLLLSGVLMTGVRLYTGAPSFKPQDNPASFANSTTTRIMSYSYIYSLNLWLLLDPWWLCFDWSMGCIPLLSSITDPRLIPSVLFWIVTISFALYTLFSSPTSLKRLTTVALSFVVIPFLPASNVFVRVGFVIAERALYLPSAGFCLLVSLGAFLISQHVNKNVVAAMLALLVAIFSTRSVHRTLDWMSEESLFTSGIKVCPLNAKVLYNIAKVRGEQGETGLAEIAYREAVRLYPEYDQALNNLGNLLKETGRVVEAEETLRAAVDANPSSAAAWMNLGIAQAAQNKTKESEMSYMGAIKHKNKYPDAFYNLGNLYIDSGRPERAIGALRKAIELQNDHQNAWANLALLYENHNLLNESESVLREAIKAIPTVDQFYNSLGVVLGKLQRYKEGEEMILKALEMSPNTAKYHSNIGVIYHFKKDYFQAKQHYRRALEIDPSLDTAKENLKKLMRIKH